MRIAIIDESAARAAVIAEGLVASGLSDITILVERQGLVARIQELSPDVVLIPRKPIAVPSSASVSTLAWPPYSTPSAPIHSLPSKPWVPRSTQAPIADHAAPLLPDCCKPKGKPNISELIAPGSVLLVGATMSTDDV